LVARLAPCALFSILFLLMMMMACGGAPKSAGQQKEKKAPEPISGQKAFFRMYRQAFIWANDAQGFKLEPIPLKAIPEHDGLWPAWRCIFVSETNRAMRSFSYSVIEAEGVREGIFSGPDERYTGPRGQNVPWPTAALRIDSPAAIETAKKHSEKYMKRFPDIPITVVLEKTKELPDAAWRVIWGTSAQASNYSVYVDAATGQYMKTMR
jgi:hypothetical protein